LDSLAFDSIDEDEAT
jgi:hypothetical protein